MPGSASPSSLNRRGRSRRASTISRLQRSPTRSRAASSAETVAGAASAQPRACGGSGHRPKRRGAIGGCHGSVSVVDCKSQVYRRHPAAEALEHRGARSHMSAIEELQSAVATVAERVGPSIVGIGRGTRGSGVVIADGTVLTNAHNLRGDEVTVTFADGRRTRGTVAGVDGDGDLAVVKVDTAGADAARVGRRRRARPSARAVFGAAASHGGGTPRHVRARLGGRARVPRARRPAHRRQRRAHRTPGARLVGRRARRRGRASSSASTRTGSARASTSRCPADAALRDAGRRAGPRRDARRAPGSASRSRRRTSRVGCAARSACPSVTASWSVASRRAARPRRPASRPATSSSRPAGKAVADGDDLFAALGDGHGAVRGQARPRRRGADRDGRRGRRDGRPATHRSRSAARRRSGSKRRRTRST